MKKVLKYLLVFIGVFTDVACHAQEKKDSVYIIGSPDIDAMKSGKLPSLEIVKEYYNIKFNEFHIVMFHPVTTETDDFELYANNLVDALTDLTDMMDNLTGCVDTLLMAQFEYNEAISSHFHTSPFFAAPTLPSGEFSASSTLGSLRLGVMISPVP